MKTKRRGKILAVVALLIGFGSGQSCHDGMFPHNYTKNNGWWNETSNGLGEELFLLGGTGGNLGWYEFTPIMFFKNYDGATCPLSDCRISRNSGKYVDNDMYFNNVWYKESNTLKF